MAFNYLSNFLIPGSSKHQNDSDSPLSSSYDAGIQTFDTADVGIFKIINFISLGRLTYHDFDWNIYSLRYIQMACLRLFWERLLRNLTSQEMRS